MIHKYSAKHEFFNRLTHGFGLILSILFLVFVIYSNYTSSHPKELGSIGLFGASLILMMAVSTAYHTMQNPDVKYLLRKLDHIAIYLLIGGSYTAYILNFYNTTEGIKFLMVHWAVIAVGVIFKLFYTGRFEILSTLLYLFLGWMVVFIYKQIQLAMPEDILNLVIIGGLFYTVGVIFYVVEKIPYNHAIWHVFVLLGAFSHFLGLYLTLQG